MKKYFTAYKNSLSSFLQYRLNLGLLLISHLVSFTGVFYLWISVYRSGQTLGNYDLKSIILYYIILTIVLITIANGVGMGFQVAQEINEGNIVNYLLKPYSYAGETFMKLLGEGTINTLFVSPAIAIFAAIGSRYIDLPPLFAWLEFLGMLFIGEIFYFLFYFLTALSSFWFERGRNVIYGMIIINLMLNGSLVPLDLFPAGFQKVSAFLPFQFLIFVPVQTLLGRIQNWPHTLLTALVWILIFSTLISITWKAGVKKFEAVGK